MLNVRVKIQLQVYRYFNHQIKTKSSSYSRYYYAEACNEWRGPSPRLSASTTQPQETPQQWRTVGAMVFDLIGWGIELCTYRTTVTLSSPSDAGTL